MTRALYRPLALIVSILGGLLASAVFGRIWKAVAGEASIPEATDHDRSWAEVIIAAGAQGAIFAAVRALVDRAGAAGFARATGKWPGREDSRTDDD